MRQLGIGVVQTRADGEDLDARFREIAGRIDQLCDAGADIIVIPEFAMTGYDLAIDQRAVAGDAALRARHMLGQWSVANRVTLVTALPQLDDDGGLYDASIVLAADGRQFVGAKRFLWGDERTIFAAGRGTALLAEVDGITIGVPICYEIGFPEVVRELVLAGAEIIAVPAAFGRPRRHVWELFTSARAVENGCIVAGAGLCGENVRGQPFAGHSTVVDPFGRRLVQLGDDPASAGAVIDLEDIGRARAQLPYLDDLRAINSLAALDN